MIVSEAVARIADDSSTNTNVGGVSARLLRHLNRVSAEVWDGHRWSFRWRNYRIVTDIDYTEGTVTATNGSRTITGSGTTFLSKHVNWHINFPQDSISNWYRIKLFSSSTSIQMDVPYTGTTGAGKTYVLRHFDYVLPTEPWDLGSVVVTSEKKNLTIFEPSSIDLIGPVPIYTGSPEAIAIYGSDSIVTSYTTGTISGSANSQTVNGSGTAWLDNAYPGDLMAIGQYTYTIYSVDSDTQITLYNQQQIASSAGTSYTIKRQFGRIARIMWPSNNAYTVDIRALRKYSFLVNDNDTNELLYRYPNAMIAMAAALELKGGDDRRSTNLMLMAESMIAKARAEDEAVTPREHIEPVYSYRNNNRRGYSRERYR